MTKHNRNIPTQTRVLIAFAFIYFFSFVSFAKRYLVFLFLVLFDQMYSNSIFYLLFSFEKNKKKYKNCMTIELRH